MNKGLALLVLKLYYKKVYYALSSSMARFMAFLGRLRLFVPINKIGLF